MCVCVCVCVCVCLCVCVCVCVCVRDREREREKERERDREIVFILVTLEWRGCPPSGGSAGASTTAARASLHPMKCQYICVHNAFLVMLYVFTLHNVFIYIVLVMSTCIFILYTMCIYIEFMVSIHVSIFYNICIHIGGSEMRRLSSKRRSSRCRHESSARVPAGGSNRLFQILDLQWRST